jgi:GNAT superfamily N-acetyltransferase
MADFDLTQLIVRDALPEDLEALDAMRPLGVLHSDRIRMAHPQKFRYLVADLNDNIAGSIMLYFQAEPGWDHRGQMPMIMDLFVPPEMRCHGIGTGIIAAAEQFCLAASYGHLYLRVEPDRNARAFNLYKRLGFQALQSEPYEDPYRFVDSTGKVTEGVEYVVDMRKWLA